MAQPGTRRQKSGVTEEYFSRNSFAKYFSECAQDLVHLTGEEALKRIEAGTAGDDAAWSELKLMCPLVKSAR